MSENEAQSCPKCGTLTKEGDVFCRVCGARYSSGSNEIKLPPETRRICWNCGNTLRPAARFCDLCGEECVRLRRERRGWKRKTNGCFLIFAAALLWLAAGVSAIAIYNASKDASFRGMLTHIRENFFVSGSGDSDSGNAVAGGEGAKEEPGGGDGAAVSEDSYDIVISNDSLPAVTQIADDEADISPTDARPSEQEGEERQTGQNSPENTGGSSSPVVRDEETKAEENTSSDAEGGAIVLVSPLNVSPESGDVAVSSDELQDSGAGAWTEQDAEGYSTVSANDRFFTSSQTPSLRGAVTANQVRVRSAPNTSSRIKRRVNSGEEVELVRRFSSGKEPYYWFEMRGSGGSGWIYGEFIKLEAGGNRVPPRL